MSEQATFYNYNLVRIQTTAEVKTPFPGWERTSVSYKHSGRADNFECNAVMECSMGKTTADLKVGLFLFLLSIVFQRKANTIDSKHICRFPTTP